MVNSRPFFWTRLWHVLPSSHTPCQKTSHTSPPIFICFIMKSAIIHFVGIQEYEETCCHDNLSLRYRMTLIMSLFMGDLVEARVSSSGWLSVKHFTGILLCTLLKCSLSTILAKCVLFSAFSEKDLVSASFTLFVGPRIFFDFQVRGETLLLLVLPSMYTVPAIGRFFTLQDVLLTPKIWRYSGVSTCLKTTLFSWDFARFATKLIFFKSSKVGTLLGQGLDGETQVWSHIRSKPG